MGDSRRLRSASRSGFEGGVSIDEGISRPRGRRAAGRARRALAASHVTDVDLLEARATRPPGRPRPAGADRPRSPTRSRRGRASAACRAASSASISSIGEDRRRGGGQVAAGERQGQRGTSGPAASSSGSARISLPLVQQGDVAGDPLDLGDLVAGEEHRPPLAGQVDHALQELATDQQVEPRGRLVQDQQLRRRGQRQRQRDLRPHPLRQRLDLPLRRQVEAPRPGRRSAPGRRPGRRAGRRGGTRRRTSRSRRRSSSRRGPAARGRSRPAGGPPARAAPGRAPASRPARRRARSGRAGPGSSSSCPRRSRPAGRRPSRPAPPA